MYHRKCYHDVTLTHSYTQYMLQIFDRIKTWGKISGQVFGQFLQVFGLLRAITARVVTIHNVSQSHLNETLQWVHLKKMNCELYLIIIFNAILLQYPKSCHTDLQWPFGIYTSHNLQLFISVKVFDLDIEIYKY